MLTYTNHDRGVVNLKYVYPVLSRRSNGISLGINLNINNTCNWHCAYCQVPNLTRGKPDKIDLDLLAAEINYMLDWILNGDFLLKYMGINNTYSLQDIAISGNGEPTLSPDLFDVIQVIAFMRAKYHIADHIKTVLITNGSIFNDIVGNSLQLMKTISGKVWFKIDRVTEGAIRAVNNIDISPASMKGKLIKFATIFPVCIQSCWCIIDDKYPSQAEILGFVEFILANIKYITEIMLYTTARHNETEYKVEPLSLQYLTTIKDMILQHSNITITIHK